MSMSSEPIGIKTTKRAARLGLHDSIDLPSTPKTVLRKKIEDKHLQQLTHLDVNRLTSLFEGVQSHNSTVLSKEHLKELLQSTGLAGDSQVIDSFYDALDVNGDGQVDKKELIIGLTILANGTLDQKLELSFHIYDLNRDGSIGKEELSTMLHTSGRIRTDCAQWSKQEVDTWAQEFVEKTFDRFDTNKDNKLSFTEFQQAAKADKEIAAVFTLQGMFTTDSVEDEDA